MDRNTQVGTDRPCIWDIPRKVSVPTKIDDLDVRYNKNNPCIAPTSAAFHSSKVHEQSLRDVECHLYRLCKGSDSLLLQVLEPPSDDSDEEIKDEQPPNMTNYMSEFIREKVNTDFLTFLKSKCDINLISKIEVLTKGQGNCTEWFKYREGRITASLAFSVCHFRDSNKEDNYIVKKIMNSSSVPLSTPAIKYGKEHEAIARLLYQENYKKEHIKAHIVESGLHVSKQYPYMGASPDGLVQCKCCGNGLLEIKCTYTHKDLSPDEVATRDKNYFVYMDDNNNVKLKTNTSWYYQIQTQLGVCDRKWCDFVFYTQKGISVDRISFDNTLFEMIVSKSNFFFNKYVIPALKKNYK